MRTYWVDLPPTAVTAQVDLAELTPADDKPIRILEVNLNQTTELGDAAEELFTILVVRGHATSGSGGSTSTPRPNDPDDAAAGFTAEIFNTTIASTGTPVNLNRHGWNVRGPLERPYQPESAPKATQGNTTIVVRLGAAPGDSVTISGSILVAEG